MIIPRILMLALLTLILAVEHVEAKERGGLVPLRSTKSNVLKFSAECANARARCQFDTAEGEVMVVFSGGDADTRSRCPKVPVGTIVLIEVRPYNRELTLNDISQRTRKYRTFNPSLPANPLYKTYYYYESGFLVTTYGESVVKLHYVAAKRDLVCAENTMRI